MLFRSVSQSRYIVEGKDSNGKIISEPLKTQGYNLDNEIATIAVKRFRERWRKEFKKSIKHWLITELGHGKCEHMHLHGILFPNIKSNNIEKTITDIWQYGYIYVGNYVNNESINYITKYVTKIDKDHKYYTPIILTSPGIGSNYIGSQNSKLNVYKGKETDQSYKTRQGTKLNLPIYYRNKIYSEEEREEIWLNLLDQNIRYVCGTKIDISKDDTTYYNVLKYNQIRNKRRYRDWETDRKSTRLNSSHRSLSRMPSSA